MSMRFFAPLQSATSSPLVTASPPAAVISSTTSCAGLVPADPSRPTPMSLTTTRAPSAANASACARPMPRPAPVMMTTRPSSKPGMFYSFSPFSLLLTLAASRNAGRSPPP
ncbi:Uncharacterised protein [Mycobacteroides abscessus subsp. abscessus]|nr:Uncharacterised protein [Mycobacteroides abscessus subsp. abscessus]